MSPTTQPNGPSGDGSLRSRVLAASIGRDRVADLVKATALLLVMCAHSLAWTKLPDGSMSNILDVAPHLFMLTWLFQILPLFFFIAGSGLTSLISQPTTARYLGRMDRLLTPASMLLLVTFVLTIAIGTFHKDAITNAAGLLPVQLTWFLGVYVCIVALTPILAKVSASIPMIVGWLAAIGAIDLVRINISESFGWINLILVWALFAILGLRIKEIRALPRGYLAAGMVGCILAATGLIIVGPYSPALISTTAVQGISNLAPPTIVLAFAGMAQICALALLWPSLEHFIHKDNRWIPVAIFATRAMQLYLYHMLFLAVGIAIIYVVGGNPTTLGFIWWCQHIAVALVAIGTVWILAPRFARSSEAIVAGLARLWPTPMSRRMSTMGTRSARLLLFVSGLLIFAVSDSGFGSPFTLHTIVGIPQFPVVVLIALLALMSVAKLGSSQRTTVTHNER